MVRFLMKSPFCRYVILIVFGVHLFTYSPLRALCTGDRHGGPACSCCQAHSIPTRGPIPEIAGAVSVEDALRTCCPVPTGSNECCLTAGCGCDREHGQDVLEYPVFLPGAGIETSAPQQAGLLKPPEPDSVRPGYKIPLLKPPTLT